MVHVVVLFEITVWPPEASGQSRPPEGSQSLPTTARRGTDNSP
jgi:hypothetical protein